MIEVVAYYIAFCTVMLIIEIATLVIVALMG